MASATRTPLALQERSKIARRLVLQHHADGGIVVAHLQGGRGDDDLGFMAHPRVQGSGPLNPMTRGQDVAVAFEHAPVLTALVSAWIAGFVLA